MVDEAQLPGPRRVSMARGHAELERDANGMRHGKQCGAAAGEQPARRFGQTEPRCSAATAMSHRIINSNPPAIAAPLTAATRGMRSGDRMMA